MGQKLPKLTLAGSSPVARSMNERGPSNGALLCLGTLHGLEPRGRETEGMHEHFPASVRGCKAPEAADLRLIGQKVCMEFLYHCR